MPRPTFRPSFSGPAFSNAFLGAAFSNVLSFLVPHFQVLHFQSTHHTAFFSARAPSWTPPTLADGQIFIDRTNNAVLTYPSGNCRPVGGDPIGILYRISFNRSPRLLLEQ